MQPHEALTLSFSQATIAKLDAKVLVNPSSIPNEAGDLNAKATVKSLSIQDKVGGKAVANALVVSRVKTLIANLATKPVAEAYARLGSDSDKNFESNMQVVTQNVMEIDDYMLRVHEILLQADREAFPGGSARWRALHQVSYIMSYFYSSEAESSDISIQRFREAIGRSRDLALHLAVKIQRSSSTGFIAL
jgi:hypothetical protein